MWVRAARPSASASALSRVSRASIWRAVSTAVCSTARQRAASSSPAVTAARHCLDPLLRRGEGVRCGSDRLDRSHSRSQGLALALGLRAARLQTRAAVDELEVAPLEGGTARLDGGSGSRSRAAAPLRPRRGESMPRASNLQPSLAPARPPRRHRRSPGALRPAWRGFSPPRRHDRPRVSGRRRAR